jgi:hypothetical protein
VGWVCRDPWRNWDGESRDDVQSKPQVYTVAYLPLQLAECKETELALPYVALHIENLKQNSAVTTQK